MVVSWSGSLLYLIYMFIQSIWILVIQSLNYVNRKMSTNIVFIYDSHMILIHFVCHDDIISYVITYKMISLINMLIFFSIFGRKVDFVLIRPGKLMSIGIPWMSHETKSSRFIFFFLKKQSTGTFERWKDDYCKLIN